MFEIWQKERKFGSFCKHIEVRQIGGNKSLVNVWKADDNGSVFYMQQSLQQIQALRWALAAAVQHISRNNEKLVKFREIDVL